MFKIKNNEIELTRGDMAPIKLVINNYTFQAGDKVEFRAYDKKALDKNPIISKTVIVDEPTEEIIFDLTSEDTKVGEMINKALVCWYEVELNDSITVIGYDSEGAKILTLYPEGYEHSEEVE